MSSIAQRLAAVAAAACLTPAAWGQVQPVQDGQALDANPRVGGLGYNTPVPTGYDISSQLYVTGQVTGLGGFHGRAGYYGEGQLHLNVPSAGLSGFRSASVGLQDVLAGQPYAAAPFYDPATTAMTVRRAMVESVGPRPDVPMTADVGFAGVSRQLYVDALASSTFVAAPLPGQQLSPLASPNLTAGGPGAGARLAVPFVGPVAAPVSPPLAGDLFAVPRAKDQLELARELYEEARKDTWQDQRVDAQVSGDPLGAARAAGRDAEPARAAGVSEDRTLGGPVGKPLGEPVANQDVFLDMLMRLRERRQVVEATTAPAEGAGAGGPPKPAPTGGGEPGKPPLVELTDDRAVVLHDLAGRSRDLFNANMTSAGQELRAGKYYDAVSHYETAGLVDPRNPLARVGMGLGLLGAGETLSAAYQLQRALTLFPPLGEARLDLSSMIDPKVVQAELGRIEQRIGQADTESKNLLTFLAAFLSFNSGRNEEAKAYAQQLQQAAQKDAFFRTYAQYVLKQLGVPAAKKPGEVEPAEPKEPLPPKQPPGTDDADK